MQLTLELPDNACRALRLSPDGLRRDLRVAAAVKWYEAEMISQGKAAELAGLSREEFLREAGRFRVSAVQATSAEMDGELGRD